MSQVSESEFIRVVGKIADKIARGFTFGIYDVADIRQEIYIIAWEAMPRYDGERSLYKFLLKHVQNRLINLKRDKFFRATCPCKKCDGLANGETLHDDKQHCKKFVNWKKTNSTKANLAGPAQLSEDFDMGKENLSLNNLACQELVDYIDMKLPLSMRQQYLKLKNGIRISNNDKANIIKYIKELVEEFENQR